MNTRRDFLKMSAMWLAAVPLRGQSKSFQGIFPIVQTPYTDSNELDLKTLNHELRFLDTLGVQGVVWPQMASEWSELTPDERVRGAELVVKVGRDLSTNPAVVIGVQGPDVESAVRYAKHAEKIGPDAIIALPPRDASNLDRVTEYYRAIAKECARPLIIQTIGDMSVDYILHLRRQIPTLRCVKDEAGHTLSRISDYHRKDSQLAVFTGAHGKTLIDELARGAVGTMPAASFADQYVKVLKFLEEGKRSEALDNFSRVCLLVNQVSAYGLPSLKYILHLRHVFPNWKCRGAAPNYFDQEARRLVKEAYEFVQG